MDNEDNGCGCRGNCPEDGGAREMDRREFVLTTARGSAAFAAAFSGLPIVAGPFTQLKETDHFVPADKRLRPEWIRALFERGASTWYSGDDLRTIAMPVGGVCAGLMYLTGDGRLAGWDIFNQQENTGYGAVNYQIGRTPDQTVRAGEVLPAASVDQGFALRVRAGGAIIDRTLDRRGFPGVRFCGEYPLGRVEYADESVPITVRLEGFSPFIPLNSADSTLPATVLHYRVHNVSDERAEVTLAGWLENAVCLHSGPRFGERFVRRNEAMRTGLFTGLLASARAVTIEREPERPPQQFANFEGGSYGDWAVEGEAFGVSPAPGTLEGQSRVSGFRGDGLVNTFLGGDAPQGRLRSPAFVIERPYIAFLIGGGSHAGRTCINLVVDGEVVRTATGANRERLEPHNWNVEELRGREAWIEIVDEESGGWGHINIDQIEFRDRPRQLDPGDLRYWPDYGSLCLAVLDAGFCRPSLVAGPMPETIFGGSDDEPEKPVGQTLRGAVGRTFTLEPGAEEDVVFVLSWLMPNLYREELRVGNHYAKGHDDAGSVASYVARNLDRLAVQTRLWHETYYDSTLPHWLLDRLHSTVANLATTTCQWWENGRFWAWEGVGCCRGTCGHVWNYEHALARLFPRLERSVREMQDFAPGVGFYPETGAIGFRGEYWTLWAGDAQGGYILKAYREHQTTSDEGFLIRNWSNIRKATEFLIERDGDADGLIGWRQHQTYDEDFYGPNTMVGSLYLGALRAAEEMAREIGAIAFADGCRRIFEAGRKHSVERLFNGEYFIQAVDLEKHPDWQYGDGCLADQMFGQGWAHQVGLGYLYPKETVASTLHSIWKYCWAPDVGPQNAVHKPERWFARPGEAGLFTCTWPKSRHLGRRSTRYRNEIWTGIEYQVAGHMAWEGLLTEALAICRAIHERYHPVRHNPWNEVECGDHYARAMASWGVLLALSGFEHHGPKRRLGFAPRIAPDDFRCAFTACEGWGSLAQSRRGSEQTDEIAVRWGRLRVEVVILELPEDAALEASSVAIDAEEIEADARQDGRRVTLRLPADTVVPAGSALRVSLRW
jgi:non-lysosomal glucosylceramidase